MIAQFLALKPIPARSATARSTSAPVSTMLSSTASGTRSRMKLSSLASASRST
ncbi:hypothetical protein ACFSQ7_47510 [Paenibacillus rhizoplanae]